MINILLATYNGENFLREQIDSILAQTYRDFNLYIHDDGSTDKTKQIIQEFTDNRIIFLDDDKQFHNSSLNFFHLILSQSECDYFAFSDQDDIWEKNKLKTELEEMVRLEKIYSKSCPLLVGTDLSLIDTNGNTIFPSMYLYQGINEQTNFLTQIYENSFTGCTMLMNYKVVEYVRKLFSNFRQNDVIQHDWFIANVCAADGAVSQLYIPTVKYRQHEANVVGAQKTTMFKHIVDGQLFTRIKKIKELKKRCNIQTKLILDIIENEILKKIAKKIINSKGILHKVYLVRFGTYKARTLKKMIIKFFIY